jgi:fatty acyl-CoA reductase
VTPASVAAEAAKDDSVAAGAARKPAARRPAVRKPAAPRVTKTAVDAAVANVSLGNAHVFLTGGTGFLGQAVLERLLSDHPGTTITLLIRKKGSTPAVDRLRTLLRKPVFSIWRDRVGDAGVEAAIKKRLRVVESGLGPLPPLPKDIDVVIHSASIVSFDAPIDQAFDTNVGGALGLYEALLKSGSNPQVVHVSTCYVGGIRKGVAPEASLTHDVDWKAEYEAAKSARTRVELASREPDQLRELIEASRASHGKEGPQAVARYAEAARVEWVSNALVDSGRTRAESLGWTDSYTLTKAFAERVAEQLWAGSGHRLSIVRPAIIESALRHPYPGWIDGFKVADPLILAYGRGQLPEFPGLPDSALDIIPVDFVVNVILAAAANPLPVGETGFYQVGSGASNPLPIHEMFQNIHTYFTKNPMPQPGTNDHVIAPTWQFPGGRKVESGLRAAQRRNDRSVKRLERFRSNERRRVKMAKVQKRRADLELMSNFTELYRAYVQTEIIFDDAHTKALDAALPADRRHDIGFDVNDIDWDDYFQNVHFPSIMAMTRAYAKRSNATERAERGLPHRTDVVAVFDLEGTVVDMNMAEQYLWVRSAGLRKAAWPAEFLSLAANVPKFLRAERRDRGEFIRVFLRRYKGMPVARLQKVVEGGYADTLLRHTLPGAVARIKEHRAAGHHIVLVTGSIGILASPLAGLFDEVVASRMHQKDGILTGYLDRPPLVDEARAAWLRQYSKAHGYDLTQSYGYGDNHADLCWLELLGNPSAVNPDTNLSREALRRRWRIYNWKRGANGLTHDGIVASSERTTKVPKGVGV